MATWFLLVMWGHTHITLPMVDEHTCRSSAAQAVNMLRRRAPAPEAVLWACVPTGLPAAS